MKSEHETWLQNYFITLEPRAHYSVKKQAPCLSMKKIVNILDGYYKENVIQHFYLKNKLSINIHRLKVSNNDSMAYFLIKLTDTRLADPGFTEIKTNNTRIEHKNSGEGISYSAHLTIDMTPDICGESNMYRAVLERTTGLSPSRLAVFLSAVIKEICQWDGTSFKHKGKDFRLWAALEIDPECTHSIKSIYQSGGKFADIELQRDIYKSGGWDEKGYTKLKVETATLSLVESQMKLLPFMKSVLKAANQNKYDRILLKMKRPDNVQETISFATTLAPQVAIEKALTDKSFFKVSQTLCQVEEEFVDEIKTESKKLLKDKR